MGKEKQNFLKKYPFITTILFLLFAWVWLVLFTQIKGGHYTYPPIFNKKIACEKGYLLQINFQENIILKNSKGKQIKFPYRKPYQEGKATIFKTQTASHKLIIKIKFPKIYIKKNKELCVCKRF